jgi:hypothetical protein
MIGPGGLLLLVPHLFALPVSVLWVQKSKEPNLDVKNIFAGSHNEHIMNALRCPPIQYELSGSSLRTKYDMSPTLVQSNG